MQLSTEIEIAPMGKGDLGSILELENALFTEPWSRTIFTSELAQRTSRTYLIGKVRRKIVAYVGVLYVIDEAHITTLGVTAAFQRHGFGKTMLCKAMRIACEKGIKTMSLEVAANNEAAQKLYHKFGFMPVGVRKNYYPKSGQDAFVLIAKTITGDDYKVRLDAIEMGERP